MVFSYGLGAGPQTRAGRTVFRYPSGVIRRSLVAAAALVLATYAWLGVYARYVADDFCTAAALHRYGFWGSQAYWRAAWSGRYTFYLAIAAVQSFGAKVVPLLPLLAIVAFVLSTRSVLGIVFVYAVIDGAPAVWQSLSWETGMLSYLAPLIVATLWLRRDHERPSWLDVVLPLIAGGFSETFTICAVVALGLSFAFTRKRAHLLALASTLVALVIMASAPGNA